MWVVLTLHNAMLTEMCGYWKCVIVLHGSVGTETATWNRAKERT